MLATELAAALLDTHIASGSNTLTASEFQPRLHHVGVVVSSIEKSVKGVMGATLATWDSKIFHDPLQKVRVTFLQPPAASDALIELVEPAADDSPVTGFAKQGGGLHHLCYEVADLDAHLKQTLSSETGGRVLLVRPPLPAVAFQNRRIAWIYNRQRILLEFLELKQRG